MPQTLTNRKRSATLALLVVCYTFALMDRHVMALLMPSIQQDLGLSDLQIGLINGFAFALLFSVASLPIGMLVDRKSRRWVIFGGMVAWSVAAAGCGLARGFWSLAMARVGVGLGEAALTPASYSILSDVYPRKQLTTALGIYAMGGSIGIIIAFAVGGLIIESLSTVHLVLPGIGLLRPWQITFIVTGLPGVLIAFLVLLLPEPPRQTGIVPAAAQGGGLRPLAGFIRGHGRLIAVHLSGFGCGGVVTYALFTWSAVYLHRRFSMSVGEIGFTLAVVLGVAGIVAKLSWGAVIDRVLAGGRDDAHFGVGALGLLMCAPAGGAAFLVADRPLCLVLMTICYIGAAVFLPAGSASLQIITPNHLRGQMSVVYLFVINALALGLASVSVPLCTMLLGGGPMMIGTSLAIVTGTFGLLGATVLWSGRRRLADHIVAVPDANGVTPV